MDIDDYEDAALENVAIAEVSDAKAPNPSASRADGVAVDDDHPFELDSYIANYTGLTDIPSFIMCLILILMF